MKYSTGMKVGGGVKECRGWKVSGGGEGGKVKESRGWKEGEEVRRRRKERRRRMKRGRKRKKGAPLFALELEGEICTRVAH